MPLPILRVARPTDDIDALLPFYRDGLGLTVLYRFEDHDGFDGIMLGHEKAPWHFEFTRARGHAAGRAPTPDNLLVPYLPDPDEWQAAVDRMRTAGFAPVSAFNPYWDREGLTFEDPDGYRAVFQRAAWSRSLRQPLSRVFDRPDFPLEALAERLPNFCHVILRLQANPEIGSVPKEPSKAERRIRRNRPTLADD